MQGSMSNPCLTLAEPLLSEAIHIGGVAGWDCLSCTRHSSKSIFALLFSLISLVVGSAAFVSLVLCRYGRDPQRLVHEPVVAVTLSSATPLESATRSDVNDTQYPSKVADAVLVRSQWEPSADDRETRGMDFEKTLHGGAMGMAGLDTLAESMLTTGFQATNVGLAIERINSMLSWRPSDMAIGKADSDEAQREKFRENPKCTIFLGYTSNMISCGVRETIKFLVKHKLVHVIVTSAGGIEEDFIKCLAPTYMGDFKLSGKELRKKGVNRIGNLLVPNQNYCLFEDWFRKILNTMTDEQIHNGTRWTPSKIIHRLGKEINHTDSVYYWAYKNDIPVFSPALTDGSLGDMLYFHNYKRPEFFVDVVEDIRRINDLAVRASCTGMIILGGGIAKHHTCNANLMRNGADFSVFINTGQEFDGSDSGASPDEAVSWGKVKIDSKPVKISADASLVFPLIVSQTFLKHMLKEGK